MWHVTFKDLPDDDVDALREEFGEEEFGFHDWQMNRWDLIWSFHTESEAWNLANTASSSLEINHGKTWEGEAHG